MQNVPSTYLGSDNGLRPWNYSGRGQRGAEGQGLHLCAIVGVRGHGAQRVVVQEDPDHPEGIAAVDDGILQNLPLRHRPGHQTWLSPPGQSPYKVTRAYTSRSELRAKCWDLNLT